MQATQGIGSTKLSKPSDLPIEITVLANLIVKDEERLEAFGILTPEMFSDQRTKTIFETMQGMVVEGKELDLVTLWHELDLVKGMAEKAGGINFVADIVEKSPLADTLIGYSNRLEQSSRRRRLLASLSKSYSEVLEHREGWDDPMDPARLWANIVGEAGLSEGGDKKIWWMRELLQGWDPSSQKKSLEEKGIPSSGMKVLDENISLFNASNFTVLAARPGLGKSSLMRQLAWSASEHGPVVIFTMEESKEAVRDKLLCTLGRVPYFRWHKGMTTPEEDARLMIMAGNLAEREIGIYGGYSVEAAHIRLAIRRLHQQKKEPVAVFVDHLNLMKHPRAESRDAAVGETTRLIRMISLETGVPVVLLCQMNRSQDARGSDEKRPRLSDLRESGMVEANAPNIMFIWKQGDFDSNEHTLTIAKHRDGPTAEMSFVFLRDQGRFEAMSKLEER